MRDALLLVDLIQQFRHDEGERLLQSFRERLPAMQAAIANARSSGMPVLYVNDSAGRWDSDAPALVRSAVEERGGGDVVALVAPQNGDRFVLKARYSGFDHTPLAILLAELEVERLLLVGAATEGCVVQTAIDARELGFKVTIIADACATNDEHLERIALHYAEQVGGVHVVRTSDLEGALSRRDDLAASSKSAGQP
jgi:nicotinamidase-related amidase